MWTAKEKQLNLDTMCSAEIKFFFDTNIYLLFYALNIRLWCTMHKKMELMSFCELIYSTTIWILQYNAMSSANMFTLLPEERHWCCRKAKVGQVHWALWNTWKYRLKQSLSRPPAHIQVMWFPTFWRRRSWVIVSN